MGVIIHFTFYFYYSFLCVILMQLNISAVKRRPVPSVLVFYLCLMIFLFLMAGILIVYH